MYANFFEIEDLEQLNIVKKALKTIKLKKNDLSRLKYELVRKLIKLMVDDLIKNTKSNLRKYNVSSTTDVILLGKCLVCFSKGMATEELALKIPKKRMYMHPKIRTMTIKAKRIISDLFDLYVKEPDLLPKNGLILKIMRVNML